MTNLEMNHPNRLFSVADDETLIELIRNAKKRLIIVSPGLTDPVATVLASRFHQEGEISITVILDADPEVCRLGYGSADALKRLHKSASENMFNLRLQEGVRIGLLIADDTVMVYSPVPFLIEAGSKSIEKPNRSHLAWGSSRSIGGGNRC